jgi:hypothetical protein
MHASLSQNLRLPVPLLFLFLPEKHTVTPFTIGPEHPRRCNKHKTVVARQGEDGLSFILRLEVPYSSHVWRTRHKAEHGVNHELVQCKVQEEDTAVMEQ